MPYGDRPAERGLATRISGRDRRRRVDFVCARVGRSRARRQARREIDSAISGPLHGQILWGLMEQAPDPRLRGYKRFRHVAMFKTGAKVVHLPTNRVGKIIGGFNARVSRVLIPSTMGGVMQEELLRNKDLSVLESGIISVSPRAINIQSRIIIWSLDR